MLSSDPGAVKITIRKFYRASGSSTQLKGVTPDLVLPSVNNYGEIGEDSLENRLDWDTIESANYEKMNRVEPYVAELKHRSEARIAADRDSGYVREDIERYKRMIAEKSVSMNEAERLKEKKDNDDRAKARKKDLASRPEPKEKVYELTLKQTDEPGLPPPVTRTNRLTSSETNLPPGEAGSASKSAGVTSLAKGEGKRLASGGDEPRVDKTPDDPAKSGDDFDESIDDKAPALRRFLRTISTWRQSNRGWLLPPRASEPFDLTPFSVWAGGVFFRRELERAVFQFNSALHLQPLDTPLLAGSLTKGSFPIRPRHPKRRLDGTLNQKALPRAALRCTGDLPLLPQDIELFGARKTLA